MKRWLAAVFLGLLAVTAIALAHAGSPAGHDKSARAQARSATGRLEAFVRTVNALPHRATPPPCSIEGSSCVRGCTVPVASGKSPRPSQDGCATSSTSHPCREMIGAATVPSTKGEASMCASPAGALRLFKRMSRAPHKP